MHGCPFTVRVVHLQALGKPARSSIETPTDSSQYVRSLSLSPGLSVKVARTKYRHDLHKSNNNNDQVAMLIGSQSESYRLQETK